ncbi:MAG: YIP1 family protein [bacterium]
MEDFEEILEDEEPKEGIKNIPWEEREKIGFFNALYMTIKDAIFKPGDFFRKIKPGSIKNAGLYALIIAIIVYLVNLSWIAKRIELNYILLIPLISLAFFFILETGLLHLGLLLLSPNKAGFTTTFKVVAYSESVLVFSIVPIIGGVISSIWGLVITIIGLSKAHNITIKKALFSVLFSIVVTSIILAISAIFYVKEVVNE